MLVEVGGGWVVGGEGGMGVRISPTSILGQFCPSDVIFCGLVSLFMLSSGGDLTNTSGGMDRTL